MFDYRKRLRGYVLLTLTRLNSFRVRTIDRFFLGIRKRVSDPFEEPLSGLYEETMLGYEASWAGIFQNTGVRVRQTQPQLSTNMHVSSVP